METEAKAKVFEEGWRQKQRQRLLKNDGDRSKGKGFCRRMETEAKAKVIEEEWRQKQR